MRIIRCSDCGKRYDYDKDEFCPKCGAFHTPPGRDSTQAEQALLTRFEGVQPVERGTRPVPRLSSRRPKRQGRNVRQEVLRSRLVLCLILLGIAATAKLLAPLADALPLGVPKTAESLVEEPFRVNDLSVTVDGAAWVPLDPENSAYRPGSRCLAVSVWITGGVYRADLHLDTPRLSLPDGTEIPLEDDPLLTRALKEYDIYAVSLRDALWEDPLMGEFVFFLPEEVSGSVTLLIDEYAPGRLENPRLRTSHQIRVALPDTFS